MTNQEFLQEALASNVCPKDFEAHYAHFCQYQAMAIDMLKSFASVCEKHNIYYCLSSGSVLGAVRDGGQIPWDYDVDVLVPFYEKDRLYQALDNDLDKRFYYCAPEKDKTYRPSIVRIVPKGYMHQVVHVDVFWLIGLPEDQKEREAYAHQVRELVKARQHVAERLSDYSYSPKIKIIRTIQKIPYMIRYGSKALADHSTFFGRYDIRQVPYAAALTSFCGKRLRPSSRYMSWIQYHTREGDFRLVSDYEQSLTYAYGDWKKYPPLEKRIAEVEKHYRIFRWYENQQKNDC